MTYLRTGDGHALVGAWFKRMNIQDAEHECSCGELESISHILFSWELKEGIRHTLRDASASLEEKYLLGSVKGLKAVAKFLSEDSTRHQVSQSGALDPQSSQHDEGLSVRTLPVIPY